MENMKVWGTPNFKSNCTTMAAANMFNHLHSVVKEDRRHKHTYQNILV